MICPGRATAGCAVRQTKSQKSCDCRLAGRWSPIARAITNSDIIYRNARSVGFRRQSELTPEQLDTRRSIPHVRLSRCRGRGEDPSHQLVPSIKERIVNRFPIFLGGTDRTVELHQLALELEEGGIIAGRILFRHRVFSCGRPHALHMLRAIKLVGASVLPEPTKRGPGSPEPL